MLFECVFVSVVVRVKSVDLLNTQQHRSSLVTIARNVNVLLFNQFLFTEYYWISK